MNNQNKDFEFVELTDDEKKLLLSAFSYNVNEDGEIIDSLLKEKVISQLTKKPLTIKEAALLSGSLKVTDSDPVTISRYLREEIEK